MSYETVTRELDRGTPPELLCATCPWDRLCAQPPTMTRAEVNRRMAEVTAPDPAATTDDAAASRKLTGVLFAALMTAGKDTSGQMCPVFVLRLSSPDGRKVADGLREQMRNWAPGESEV